MISSRLPPARLLVVIVNYRTPDLTIDCLRSLEPEVRSLGSTRVVVTDNASGDGSPERIRGAITGNGWSGWASLMPLDHNGGYSFGNNAAIRPALESSDPAPPDYVLLLNSDTVVLPGALQALVEFMDARPDVGIAGSRLEDQDGTLQHSRYRFHTIWSELETGLKLGVVTRLLRRRVIAPPLVDTAHPADWVAGASMIIRRKVFEDIGLLDSEYFLYFEEVDFCLNARRAGWSCWYVPRSRVVHYVGCSTGVTSTRLPALRRPRYWFESRRRYFVKNHGRAYALCADAAWVAGFSLWRVRRILQRKPDRDPPHMLWDFLRTSVGTGRNGSATNGRANGASLTPPTNGGAPPRAPPPPAKRSLARALKRLLIAGAITCALLEVAARAFTGVSPNGMPRIGRFPLIPYRPTESVIRERLARDARSTYVVRDPEIGWTIGPDGEQEASDEAPAYRSNRQGVRADPARVYAPDPPPGKVRIVTVGDSFTHCDDVADTETWQRYLEGDNADLEVLNLGVPGYGSDQALLRWRRDGRRFRSQIVLLGIWPEDMCRNLNLVRYYLVPSEGFVTKPRMIPRDGELAVINSPVLGPDELVRTLTEPESHPLLRNDAWYRESETQPRLALESRAVRVAESLLSLEERKRLRARMYEGSDRAGIDMTVAIAEEFAREVRAAGSTPLVLLIPMRDLLALHTAREPFPLVGALRARGIDVLDLGPSFGRAVLDRGVEPLYVRGGHHSAEGNRLLAGILEQELRPWIEGAKR